MNWRTSIKRSRLSWHWAANPKVESTPPIACTLTGADLADRQRAWLKVGAYSLRCDEISGGLAFDFKAAPGVSASLERLIPLEAECCPWMTFRLDNGAETIRMTVTAAGADGERAVREMFSGLGGAAGSA
jgi:hypothetical protein